MFEVRNLSRHHRRLPALDVMRNLTVVGRLIAFTSAALWPLVVIVMLAPLAHSQILHASGPRPSFQVATIKPSKPDETRAGMSLSDGGRGFITTNATVRDLIQEAYNVKAANQIVGANGWMTTDKFDIEARLEDSQFAKLANAPIGDKIQQIRLMLQSLLEERFALKLSESTRQSSFFSLVQTKGGSKMKPTAMAPADPNGVNLPHPVMGPSLTRKGPGKFEATGVSIPMLADALSRLSELGATGGFTIGELVVDKTGLPGSYDWSLTWTPDSGNEGGDVAQNANAPSLFTALQEQLGLKLERTKGQVEVLVIDHVERPSAN
jgi:uncharacterized protein (TIGR03435 family)